MDWAPARLDKIERNIVIRDNANQTRTRNSPFSGKNSGAGELNGDQAADANRSQGLRACAFSAAPVDSGDARGNQQQSCGLGNRRRRRLVVGARIAFSGSRDEFILYVS